MDTARTDTARTDTARTDTARMAAAGTRDGGSTAATDCQEHGDASPATATCSQPALAKDGTRGLPMVTIRMTSEERRRLRKAAALDDADSLQQWARLVLLQAALEVESSRFAPSGSPESIR